MIGSRYVGGIRVVDWPLHRLFLSRGASMYVRLVTGLPFQDPTGGFKCFRRATLEAMDLRRVRSNGYSFQIEMTHDAWLRGFAIHEVPITFVERRSGHDQQHRVRGDLDDLEAARASAIPPRGWCAEPPQHTRRTRLRTRRPGDGLTWRPFESCMAAAHRTNRPAVATFHGWTNWPSESFRGRVYPWADRRALRRANLVVTNFEAMAGQLTWPSGGPLIVTIPNGVDTGMFDPSRVRSDVVQDTTE